MIQYKTVPAPSALQVSSKESQSAAVNAYASILNAEAQQGWELVCIQEVPVVQNPGCFMALLGAKSTVTTFNMLVFKRQY